MRILLPPSEGKSRPRRGRPWTAHELSFPELDEFRHAVHRELAAVSARADALELLGVGASLADEVAANTSLAQAPAARAAQVYTGVLYEALGATELGGTALRRLRESCIVISAAFGAVRLSDRIPAYRLSMGTALPELGRLSAAWRDVLTPVLDAECAGHLLVDCRSADYRAAWPAPKGRTVEVQVLTRAGGRTKVVTHMAKKARGELTRHLCERPAPLPKTPVALLAAASERWEAELDAPRSGTPGQLRLFV
ncbi:YaaA family protein [Sediminivirga luteola]|uniref:UPF0246 protein n=1 Tax=Sediminivirga luteola TaxID=1774748 RepID=A0A8J2U062_9MICO|nr:peroxide stress protein YaaA [Sediminivirga luteola]MCI2263987.1 peroxide stress protein YaaA [Sediminivirga luteola]GGA23195.1 UPF0246 protein [Sediminivirga luteola]